MVLSILAFLNGNFDYCSCGRASLEAEAPLCGLPYWINSHLVPAREVSIHFDCARLQHPHLCHCCPFCLGKSGVSSEQVCLLGLTSYKGTVKLRFSKLPLILSLMLSSSGTGFPLLPPRCMSFLETAQSAVLQIFGLQPILCIICKLMPVCALQAWSTCAWSDSLWRRCPEHSKHPSCGTQQGFGSCPGCSSRQGFQAFLEGTHFSF